LRSDAELVETLFEDGECALLDREARPAFRLLHAFEDGGGEIRSDSCARSARPASSRAEAAVALGQNALCGRVTCRQYRATPSGKSMVRGVVSQNALNNAVSETV
jgi:hypothetical protein